MIQFKKYNLQAISKDQLYFKGKEVAFALGYKKPHNAIETLVSDEYKKTWDDIQGPQDRAPLQPHTIFLKEPGLYKLIFSSKLPKAKLFRKWVFEEVLPALRKKAYDGANPLIFKIENEFDLHKKVVNYIRRFYPPALIIAGLGELQDTSSKRIKSWQKCYQKGQPDLIIGNRHQKYSGLCLELKTPTGKGVSSPMQSNVLKEYKKK